MSNVSTLKINPADIEHGFTPEALFDAYRPSGAVVESIEQTTTINIAFQNEQLRERWEFGLPEMLSKFLVKNGAPSES